MRIVFGLLAVAAGCGDDGGMFPVGGGGTDGGLTFPDSPRSDSAISGSDALLDGAAAAVDANIFTGRVCLAADPRKLNTCATTGAGGLTVRLGTAVTTTADNGSFMIAGQPGALVWRVTGTNIVSSYMAIGDYEIPAISRTVYNAMIANNLGGLQMNPGEGSLMVQVIQNGVGRSSAFGQTEPLSAWQAFYDGADATPTTFQQTTTGVNGTVWFAGLDVGSATAKVTFGDEIAKGPLPIFDGGITFTTIIFP